MVHEQARQLLANAETFAERGDAVESALELGMSLREIEEYLDWLDNQRSESKDEQQ